jgi:hypothetical protein
MSAQGKVSPLIIIPHQHKLLIHHFQSIIDIDRMTEPSTTTPTLVLAVTHVESTQATVRLSRAARPGQHRDLRPEKLRLVNPEPLRTTQWLHQDQMDTSRSRISTRSTRHTLLRLKRYETIGVRVIDTD